MSELHYTMCYWQRFMIYGEGKSQEHLYLFGSIWLSISSFIILERRRTHRIYRKKKCVQLKDKLAPITISECHRHKPITDKIMPHNDSIDNSSLGTILALIRKLRALFASGLHVLFFNKRISNPSLL